MSETEEKKNVKKYKERNIILMRVTYTTIYVANFFYIVVFKIAI